MSGNIDGYHYSNHSRKELQKLCKLHGLPANRSNSVLISSLAPYLEGPMPLEDSIAGFFSKDSIFAKDDRTKKVSIDGVGTSEANLSPAKTRQEAPHVYMEFHTWDDKGINLVVDLNASPSDWIKMFKDECAGPMCGSIPQSPGEDLSLLDENGKRRKSLSLHISDVDELDETDYNQQGVESLVSALQKSSGADAALPPSEDLSLLDENGKERKSSSLHIIDVDERNDKFTDYNQQGDESLVSALQKPCDVDASAAFPPREDLSLLDGNGKERKNSSLHIIDVDELDDKLTGYNQQHQGDKSLVSALQKPCGFNASAALPPLGLICIKNSSEAENGGLVHLNELNLDSNGNSLPSNFEERGAGKYDWKEKSKCSQLDKSVERMSSPCLESEMIPVRKRKVVGAADRCADDNPARKIKAVYRRRRTSRFKSKGLFQK